MEKAKILIVEDDAIVAMEIESQVKRLEYGVTGVVAYGEAVIAKIKENKPDLVLMDIVLKGEMDGIEAAEIIRSRFGIPVIFLAAYADEKRLERAKLTTPFGFILKPFQDKDLKVTIEMALYANEVIAVRELAEKALAKSQAEFQAIFHSISDAVVFADTQRRILMVNPAFTTTFGYEFEEVKGRTTEFLYALKEDYQEIGRKRYRGGIDSHCQPFEVQYRHKDGTLFWAESHGDPVRDVHGAAIGFFATHRDITERRQVEEALRKSERKLRVSEQELKSIVNNAPDIIYRTDTKGNIIFVNQTVKEYGFSTEELIGKNILELVHPDDQKKATYRVNERRTGDRRTKSLEIRLLTKDLAAVPFESKSRDFGSFLLNAEGIYSTEKPGPDSFVGTQGIARDISERKRLEEELLKTKKLESVGILAGGIAHDFNNLLLIIMGYISLAKNDITPEAKAFEFLNEAEKASWLARDLTKQLITFSEGGATVKKISYISNLIEKATHFALSGSNIGCQFNMPGDLWPVEIDQGQIRHVINNVVINAVRAMPKGGTIEVCAENFMSGSDKEPEELSLQDGKYVKLSIQDQGIGISDKDLPMIFDPYYSSKERGTQKGMGLGLATSYSIIKNHNGEITAESKAGVGTTITIYLPASEIEPVKKKSEEKAISGKGRILIMDDEELVRNMAVKILKRLGYKVEFSKNGEEAIESYREAMQSGNPFDAVILDLTVRGGLGGKEAIQKLAKIDPDVKGIVSSGHSEDPVMNDFGKYGFCSAIAKPYSMPELSVILDKVITEGKSARLS